MWHFLVRVWRRHWLDDTTQFTCIRNRLKINTEPQEVCTRKWIADVGSHTFLGQTFDNCKWWPDFVFTVSKWASLKRGLEIVLKQLGRQKRGTFMGHLWTRGWDWDGCKCHKCQICSFTFMLPTHTVSPDVAGGSKLLRQSCHTSNVWTILNLEKILWVKFSGGLIDWLADGWGLRCEGAPGGSYLRTCLSLLGSACLIPV